MMARWNTLLVLAALIPSSVSGEVVEVSGTVTSADVEGGVARLRLDDPSAPQVVLVVGWLSGFPPSPEKFYAGKTISVRGALRSFRGTREIEVRDAADITVVAGAPLSNDTPPGSSAEINELRQQIQQLDERIRKLERRTLGRDKSDE